MHLLQFTLADELGIHRHFEGEVVEVTIGFVLVTGNYFVTTAVVAKLMAKWNMNVQAHLLWGMLERLHELALVPIFGQRQCCWILCVTRAVDIVFID